jgi:hypothetical protein
VPDQKNGWLLAPDNFTGPARTPWGGTRIRALKGMAAGQVGESWELSVEPSFPSRFAGGELLSDRIARAPRDWLGAELERGSTALLVKLLDAADELSVQIHPRDDYEGLAPGESGKPECWYVVERDPGACLYIGLRPSVDAAAMSRALDGGDVPALLERVVVEPGDFFVIDAGTPHCIGRGVLLVEPQRVLPGRRGVTYRYWDWDRRYDTNGQLDPSGAPRELHRAHALAVTEWDRPRVEPVRAGAAQIQRAAHVEALGRGALDVWRIAGTGPVTLPSPGRLRSLTILEGTIEGASAGRTFAIPAVFDGVVTLDRACAIVAATS